MASCATCGTTILFGGVNAGGLKFCGKKCAAKNTLLTAAMAVPDDLVFSEALQVFEGKCPQCGGDGPIDLRYSHRIHSLVYISQWKSIGLISCAQCAKKKQLGSIAYCAGLGWWGFPWGIIGTPIQIARNISE